MKERIDLFTRILERFKFREPLPELVRKLLYTYKRSSISDVLKHFGEYKLMTVMTVNTYYALRRIKLRPSMAQSRLLIGISTTLFTAAAVFLISYMLLAKVIKPTLISTPDVPPSIIKEKISGRIIEKISVTRIAVKPLTSSFIDKKALYSATRTIHNRLSSLKGNERVITLRGRKQGYSYLLSGSVERLGKTVIISVNLIDAESGRIVYNTLERTMNAGSINKIFKRIAGEAAGKVKF